MEVIGKLFGSLMEHLTIAELIIIAVLIEAAMLLFLAEAILRLARFLKLISNEKYEKSIAKRARSRKRKRWVGLIYGSIAALLIVGMGFQVRWQPQGPIKHWTNTERDNNDMALVREATSYLEDKDIRDLCIGIIWQGASSLSCFSQAPADDAASLDGDTVFEIGSITKTFTYSIMLEILDEYGIQLHSSIGPYLPHNLASDNPALAKISWLQLATHTSGLARLPIQFDLNGAHSLWEACILGDPYGMYDSATIVDFLRTAEIPSEPLDKPAYSNLAVGLLGALLSSLEGKSYSDITQERLLVPLDMTNTVVGRASIESQMIKGYGQYRTLGPIVVSAVNDRWTLRPPLDAAGAITASTSDMVKYLGFVMDAYNNPQYRDSAHRFRIDDETSVNLGWFETLSDTGQTIVWHDGATGGFRSFLGFDDATQTGVVILSNSTRGVGKLGFRALAVLGKAR